MLLCGIDDVTPGTVLGALVSDPMNPAHDLLRPGVVLDKALLTSLRKRGVIQLWVEDNLTRVAAAVNDIESKSPGGG